MTWTARLAGTSRFYGPRAVVEGPMGDLIAEIPADPGQDPMPRARLIAAAPELKTMVEADLVLVQEMRKWADGLRNGTTRPVDLANHIERHALSVEKNRAMALAKAVA